MIRRTHTPRALPLLLAAGALLAFPMLGRARAQAQACLDVALCADRREPFEFYWNGPIPTGNPATLRIPVTVPPGKCAVVQYVSIRGKASGPSDRRFTLDTPVCLRIRSPGEQEFREYWLDDAIWPHHQLYMASASLTAFIQPGDEVELVQYNVNHQIGRSPLTLTGYLLQR